MSKFQSNFFMIAILSLHSMRSESKILKMQDNRACIFKRKTSVVLLQLHKMLKFCGKAIIFKKDKKRRYGYAKIGF